MPPSLFEQIRVQFVKMLRTQSNTPESMQKMATCILRIMPYRINRLPSGKYRVTQIDNGQIKARATTLRKAEAQVRVLHFVDAQAKRSKRT